MRKIRIANNISSVEKISQQTDASFSKAEKRAVKRVEHVVKIVITQLHT